MRNTFFICFILLLLTSCGRKTIVRKYYLIKTAPVERIEREPVTSATCQVEPVDIYPEFTTERIAQRNETHEIVYYSNHFWAIKPGETMTRILVNHLGKAGIFRSVDNRFYAMSPDYSLETTVYQLEVFEEEKDLKAHLHLEFVLKENVSGNIILTHSNNLVEPLPDRDMNSFAALISTMFHQEIMVWSGKIKTYFEQ